MENEKPCRHEYVRIYQRKLKGLERRLVSTRAYLPIGFKQADFAHLSEGSYCFCTKCRARLYPRRTAAEKAQARLVAVQSRALAASGVIDDAPILITESGEAEFGQESLENVIDNNDGIDDKDDKDIHVEELELESVDVQDIEAEGVKLSTEEEESDSLTEGEDI